jgi:hypothetical protein
MFIIRSMLGITATSLDLTTVGIIFFSLLAAVVFGMLVVAMTGD